MARWMTRRLWPTVRAASWLSPGPAVVSGRPVKKRILADTVHPLAPLILIPPTILHVALVTGAHDTVTTLRKAAEADSAAAAAEEASKTDQEKMDEEVESVMKTLKPRHGHGKATNASELMADPETDEFMGRANADIVAIANDALKLKGKMHGAFPAPNPSPLPTPC
jgi:hypothetical protein